MPLPEFLEEPLEKLRTDPAGFAAVGLGAVTLWYLDRHETTPSVSAATSLASLGLIAAGLVHLGNMFEYTERLEESLRDRGFEHTQFRVRAYCLRQASRVVCQKTGYLEEYLNLCADTQKQRLSFLPHL